MKIANVVVGDFNVRPDWPVFCDWVKRCRPDIIALQKIWNEQDFPTKELQDIGYASEFLGKRSRSDLGVAILSQRKLKGRFRELSDAQEKESRFLTVDIGDLRISSVYAPYGPRRRAIECRVAWLHRLRNHISKEDYSQRDSLLCGDFNVKLDGPPWGAGFSKHEKEALQGLLDLGFCDLFRTEHRDVEKEPGYTRGYDEECSNGTSRLHLILASKNMARRLLSARVDIESKPWPRKDAPPVVVDLDDA